MIDADLGLSGRSATHRDGFKHLVARGCLGAVGAVCGLEGSRLARNHGLIASFSRALTEDLRHQQTDEEFDRVLDSAVANIYRASTT